MLYQYSFEKSNWFFFNNSLEKKVNNIQILQKFRL